VKLTAKATNVLQPASLGGQDFVELVDPTKGAPVLKAYGSADGRKIRVVLPELKGGNFTQVKIDLDHGLIDFTRDPVAARRELAKRTGR
jgi:hypothetical protein